uniref:Uncharacterized protein n=1 Tax=Brassica oleracea TaxID=3712 RepID=A0A3P6G2R5_BRAOL|nr:unnamed protein product [Brassica oleracea]
MHIYASCGLWKFDPLKDGDLRLIRTNEVEYCTWN